jgi:hypothetical protein
MRDVHGNAIVCDFAAITLSARLATATSLVPTVFGTVEYLPVENFYRGTISFPQGGAGVQVRNCRKPMFPTCQHEL